MSLETRPESVAIVALGPSNHDYVHAMAAKKGFLDVDEIWTVNSGLGLFNADKCFIMDDLRRIEKRYPEWAVKIRKSNVPIITCRQYDDYPMSEAYPIDEVIKDTGDDYFTTTPAYMVGYAMLIGVRDLYLFGVDYQYPGMPAVEGGAECVSYLLGMAKMRGIKYHIPQNSTMLDANMCKLVDGNMKRPLYGYDYNPGDCLEKVKRGTASDEEKIIAGRAPIMNKPKADGKDGDIKIPGNGGKVAEEQNGIHAQNA